MFGPVGERPDRWPRRIGAWLAWPVLFLWISCDSSTAPQPVDNVVVTPGSVALAVGQSVTLEASAFGRDGNALSGRSITWSSSAADIANVSGGGVVAGVSAGSAIITATSEGKTGTAVVTVIGGVAFVDVQPSALSLAVGESAQLTATPRDETGAPVASPVTWSSSDGSVAEVSSTGMVTGVAEGTATLTATSEGQSGTATAIVGGAGCQPAGTVDLTAAVTGTLEPGPCTLEGRHHDPWLLELDSATEVRIDLTSSEFDAYLIVTDLDDNILFEDDDSGDFTNARIEETVPPGSYIIWARSFYAGETGSYQLTVQPADGACTYAGTLAVGQTVSGTLAASFCTFDGWNHDAWLLELPAETAISIDLVSADFDAYLLLSDLEGTMLFEGGDGGEGTNARLQQTLEAGSYTVWASSWGKGETGAYQLTVQAIDDACVLAGTIALGQTVTRTLGPGPCTMDGFHLDPWALTLDASSEVQIDLLSAQFDAYVIVTDTEGNILFEDDDGGDGADARIRETLESGSYVVWATSFSPGETGSYQLSVTGVDGDGLNLRISALYVTQAVQTLERGVPLVAGRPALLRVFATANRSNSVSPNVRVRLFEGATLLDSFTIAAQGGSVPSVVHEDDLAASWNLEIPAGLMRPGLRVLAEVDPDDEIPETDTNDNVYPANGVPLALDVRPVPALGVRLIPVRQSANGLVGDVSEANKDTFVALTAALFPFSTVDADVRATYTTDLPVLQPNDANGSWVKLLAEIDALRLAEGTPRLYYGVVRLPYSSGILGVGYIGRPASLGLDAPGSAAAVTAHEIGHNLGRLHAPCGNPSGVDARYPYPDGTTGVYGYDTSTGSVRPPTSTDIMGYCSNQWISDYTYEAVIDFATTSASVFAADSQPEPTVLIWGYITPERAVLEPMFDIVAPPVLPAEAGPFTFEAVDEAGNIVHTFSFAGHEIADAGALGARTFAFAIRRSELPADRVAAVRLRGPGVSPAALGRHAVDPEEGAPTTLRALRRNQRLALTWDGAAYPMALVTDARTGEILSFARDGRTELVTDASAVELVFSDGIRSVRERLEIQ